MELTKKAQKIVTQRLENMLFACIENENFYANAKELTLEQFKDLAEAILYGEEGAGEVVEKHVFSWHALFVGNAAIAYP